MSEDSSGKCYKKTKKVVVNNRKISEKVKKAS